MNKLVWHEFSATASPLSERLSDASDEHIWQTDFASAAKADTWFSGTIKRCRLGMVDVARITTATVGPLPGLSEDGSDALSVIVCLAGGMLRKEGEASLSIEPGEGLICDSSEAGVLLMEAGTRCWVLTAGRADMARTVPHIRHLGGLKLNNTGVALQLLVRYLEALHGSDQIADDRQARLFGDHLLDLIGMAVGTDRQTRQLAERRGVRAARHAAVLREIERNVSDGRLSAAAVAEKLGVTPRYVHFLLEESGQTFSEHVLSRRLKLAEELLARAENASLKISALARQAGFTDMSYFNRCFRARFGNTPTGYRKQRLERPATDQAAAAA